MNTNTQSRVMHMAHRLRAGAGNAHPWASIVKYAWYFERLRRWMHGGIVTFSYWKKDGSIREARGTLCPSLIPEDKMPKGLQNSAISYQTFRYFDLDRNDWRSFDISLFIGFVTIEELKEKRTKRENA